MNGADPYALSPSTATEPEGSGSLTVAVAAVAALGHTPEPLREVEQFASDIGKLASLGQLLDLGGDPPVVFGARSGVAHLGRPRSFGLAGTLLIGDHTNQTGTSGRTQLNGNGSGENGARSRRFGCAYDI